MTNFIPIVLVAISGVLGNIIYFEYKLKKERRKEILKKRLTDLLLPLYFVLKEYELMIHAWLKSETDPYEYESGKPERLLNNLMKIIKENIYLADDELHVACAKFIEWAYKCDSDERFQRAHLSGLSEDKIIENFTDIVHRKYA